MQHSQIIKFSYRYMHDLMEECLIKNEYELLFKLIHELSKNPTQQNQKIIWKYGTKIFRNVDQSNAFIKVCDFVSLYEPEKLWYQIQIRFQKKLYETIVNELSQKLDGLINRSWPVDVIKLYLLSKWVRNISQFILLQKENNCEFTSLLPNNMYITYQSGNVDSVLGHPDEELFTPFDFDVTNENDNYEKSFDLSNFSTSFLNAVEKHSGSQLLEQIFSSSSQVVTKESTQSINISEGLNIKVADRNVQRLIKWFDDSLRATLNFCLSHNQSRSIFESENFCFEEFLDCYISVLIWLKDFDAAKNSMLTVVNHFSNDEVFGTMQKKLDDFLDKQ